MSRIIKDISELWAPSVVIRESKLNGWVLYDSECPYCVAMVEKHNGLLAKRGLQILPLQTAWVRTRFKMDDAEWFSEMRLLLTNGRHFGGGDALIEICRRIWWAWPVWMLAVVPWVREGIRGYYRQVARRRHCVSGSCAIECTKKAGRISWVDFLPMLLLTATPIIIRNRIPDWLVMCLVAMAITAGWKWVTYRQAIAHGARPMWSRCFGYLFAWIGMDADEFFDDVRVPAKAPAKDWVAPILKMIAGILLVWRGVRQLHAGHPMISAWVGMFGISLILHFGLFQIMSLAWRRSGVNATPLMQEPLLSESLGDFWGRRWNTAFNELAFRFTFRPLSRWSSPKVAGLLVFVLSGLVHELVISVPARGGYGCPTVYFVLQGLGLLVQRARWARRFGFDRGVGGWLFTVIVTAGPVYWLFHPTFIQHVILPLLSSIGAIGKEP